MTGESTPLALPLLRFAKSACEATTLYQELRKPLLRYLVGLGLSSDDAQDVVQDAFLSLQRRLEATGRQAPPAWAKSDSQENIRGWLFRVAHNRARNRQTSYDRRFAAPLEAASDAIAEQASPERAVLEKEKFRRLREAVERLTAPERECLLLRAGGLRYREIAATLGMATSTVGDTIERAIKKLAEKCNV
jgi:RNA polymerase sigma-70 factor, ECF subfamily